MMLIAEPLNLPTPEPVPGIRQAIAAALNAAMPILTEGFGTTQRATRKESQSSIVTEIDVRSEAAILAALRSLFPDHGFLTEESGFLPGTGRWEWIIDPLDGTSNFAAGIPWFGVMLALVEEGQPVAAAISLPAMGEQYYAECGAGSYRNGQRIHVLAGTNLADMLVAYGMDWNGDLEQTQEQALALGRLVTAARNVRITNSVVDDCFVASGRLGAAVNRAMKLWDLASAALLISEAGGCFTDLHGQAFDFHVTPESSAATYARVAAPRSVHHEVLAIVTGQQ